MLGLVLDVALVGDAQPHREVLRARLVVLAGAGSRLLDGDLAGDAAVGQAEQLAHVEDDGGERHPADLHVVFLARVVAR